MALESDAKFEEKLTCGSENNSYKIEMKTLMNFNPSTQKSKKFEL